MRWLYRAALRLHASGFRDRFAREMELVFEQRCVETRARRGRTALIVLCIRESLDVAIAAWRTPRTVNAACGNPRPRPPMTHALTDFIYAFRQIRHRPGFALATIATLGLAIGANTAVFTVVNAVLLRPLPYPEPERLVGIFAVSRQGNLGAVSPLDWHDYGSTGVFESIAAIQRGRMTLTGAGEPETLRGFYVTRGFFTVLRTPPAIGRTFRAGDANADGTPLAVVLAHGLWQRRFGGDPAIIGRTVELDGVRRPVVGVMPAGFEYPPEANFWVPLEFSAEDLRPNQRGAVYLSAIARLKPEISVEAADARIAELARRLEREHPRSNDGRGGAVRSLHGFLVRDVRTALLTLLGAVMLVLLIACANVGNLFLARAAGRETEIAIRTSLGATGARLVQQFLAEGLVLAILGGLVGVALAVGGVDGLLALAPERLPAASSVTADIRVLLFAFAVTAAAGVIFGLTPALHALAGGTTPLAQRASTRSRRHRLTQHTLIVAELTMAIVLLAGAGLLARSFLRLASVNPGFDPSRVLTFTLSLADVRYDTTPKILGFYDRVVSDLKTLPGIERVGLVLGLPMTEVNLSSTFTNQDRPDQEPEPSARFTIISGEYFQALRIPLRNGRLFTSRDETDGPGVAIINETAAREYWPGVNPVGRRLRLHAQVADWRDADVREIVGVVGDVRQRELGGQPTPEIYIPYSQQPVSVATVVARTAGEPAAALPAAADRIRAIDPDVPISQARPLTHIVRDSVANQRFNAQLVALFAGAALLLAFVGVYGVMSYSVAQRTREMGVRIALGAAEGDLLRLVIGQALKLAVLGAVLGSAGALVIARVLRGLLYEVDPGDPLTLAAVILTLSGAVLLASYIPARRATRVDPMTTLRAD